MDSTMWFRAFVVFICAAAVAAIVMDGIMMRRRDKQYREKRLMLDDARIALLQDEAQK